MANKAMCESTSEAKANRQRVANDYGGSWWREQESICEGWKMGELAPKSLALGNLPIILHTNTHK